MKELSWLISLIQKLNNVKMVFPICPVYDNDVKKPAMFVFKDMEDYKARGKNVDKEYAATLETKKGTRRASSAKGAGLKGKKII